MPVSMNNAKSINQGNVECWIRHVASHDIYILCKFLMSAGVKADVSDHNGNTPLHRSVLVREIPAVTALLEHDPSLACRYRLIASEEDWTYHIPWVNIFPKTFRESGHE